jgi:molybdopterin-guanine dinucleotide biosynthesis protein MobB
MRGEVLASGRLPVPKEEQRSLRMPSMAPRVFPGIDLLLEDPSPIAGKRIALITNPSGVSSNLVPTWRALAGRGEFTLTRLFGPEHGIDARAQDMEEVGGARHDGTGLPVRSLYGATFESLKLRQEDVAGVDAVVFDIQDVGSRYYTFVWTMALAMETCAHEAKRFVVLDRPNPIGGAVEGAPQAAKWLSFVGGHSIAVRHGMTAGEIARLVAGERGWDLDLVVVPARGWARSMRFADTGLPWIPPSPNMPTAETALVYPGGCLVEATNLSEGRGTTRPFEYIGAPWLDGERLAAALARRPLPGARFLPAVFRPTFQKHAGKTCGGIFLRVEDAGAFRPYAAGLEMIRAARELARDHFAWRTEPYEFETRPAIDLLTGSPAFRRLLEEGDGDFDAFLEEQERGASAFRERRKPFLIYPDERPAFFGIVGSHNAGKTTLIERLVPALASRGLSVGAVKHTPHDVEDDTPGKDSERLMAAGANPAAFLRPSRTTLRTSGSEASPEELRRAFGACDIVLVEGFQAMSMPRIEVRRRGIDPRPVPPVLARVTDGSPMPGDRLPAHRPDDLDAIVSLILKATTLDRVARA